MWLEMSYSNQTASIHQSEMDADASAQFQEFTLQIEYPL